MTEILGQFQISRQFQDSFAISGISGPLGPLYTVCNRTMGDFTFWLNFCWANSL